MKIIQISDTHLFADDSSEIFGVKSNFTFEQVVTKMVSEDTSDTDIIFLTGDISQDETEQAYQKIANHLSNLDIPIYWIPGNHDNLVKMEKIFQRSKNFYHNVTLSIPHWHFIFLNTKIENREDGYLSLSELTLLQNELQVAPIDKKIAIVMHHHPAPVSTPLIDNYILANNQDFWNIITETKVELVICGHVHGDYSFNYNNVMIESSPATCLQWEKGTTELKMEMKIGYKVYYFGEKSYQALAKMW